MIHVLGSKKFGLSSDKLCFGYSEQLQIQVSDGDKTAGKSASGTIDILFMDPEYVFIWAPVK